MFGRRKWRWGGGGAQPESNIKETFGSMSGIIPSASRGDQCPEGAQGRGEEELEAYWSRTLPSVHLSHTDPTSLGNQQTGRANNLDTGQKQKKQHGSGSVSRRRQLP